MGTAASAIAASRARGLTGPLRRCAFLALLAATPLLEHVNSDVFYFPAVLNGWVLLPLGALFMLPMLDLRGPLRWAQLDLLALVCFAVALACEEPLSTWPVLLAYPPLAYLALRMIALARARGLERPLGARAHAPALRALLGTPWLVLGIAVLACVHVDWALSSGAVSDVGEAGVAGALRILHGHALYGRAGGAHVADGHLDTYGPLDYVAYVPFAALAGATLAAHLAALFFDLLTAALLLALGRLHAGVRAGVLLAFCWLAFPLTFYEDALGYNDSLVAAALVTTLLVARSPARRGAMAALAAWTKLSPLALVGLLALHRTRGARMIVEFAGAFALASALVFVPALSHDSIHTFLARTVGFQSGRAPSGSLWWALQNRYAMHMPWLGALSRVAHGLLVAGTGALAVMLLRVPDRDDIAGLAAACAALLTSIEICLGYWSYSYVLWFSPLVLVALILRSRPADELEQRIGEVRRRCEDAPGEIVVHRQVGHAQAGAFADEGTGGDVPRLDGALEVGVDAP